MRSIFGLAAICFAATSTYAQVCVSPGVYGGNIISERVIGNSYSAPVRHHQKEVIIQQDDYVAPQVSYQGGDSDLVGALGTLAEQQQKYAAMIEGLNSLGFASTASSQQSYSSYAQAPYEQGTTAYSVRDVEVDAFGPQDVREIMSSVSRYSTQANSGANQLMSQAQKLSGEIASSVQQQSQSALHAATIDAETRNVEAVMSAVIKALEATRPQQQTRVRIEGREREAYQQATGGAGEERWRSQGIGEASDPSQGSGSLVEKHCLQCHASYVQDPPGGFRISSVMMPDDVAMAAQAVLSGSMPEGQHLPTEERLEIVAELQRLAH